MSTIIIPLAGPDFYTEKFGIRPLFQVGNLTLIEHVLNKRPWLSNIAESNNQLIFVLRDVGLKSKLMQEFIQKRFPCANTVVLGKLSEGAPFSALAGIAISKNFEEPVIVDLADIGFNLNWNYKSYFQDNDKVDAILPYFRDINPKYSYLKLNGNSVLEAREKQVISSQASAGVYFFRNVDCYLRALIYCIQEPHNCKVGESFFLCPAVNGLITNNRQVHALEVTDIEPISALFHEI